MKTDSGAKLIRAVGFWGLVALTINAVIGSGVYLLPSASYRLLGPFSLWAPLLFAIPVFVLVLCFAEAASHFDEPGGAYMYARGAFGDFIGFETGWMNTLARLTSLAALSNGFVLSVAWFEPSLGEGAPRILLITLSLLAFAGIHILGIRQGARTIYGFTIGKLVPLLIFIVLAAVLFKRNPIPESLHLPGAGTDWSEAALLLLFAYAGFENVGVPAGEFRNPKRDLPLALLLGTLGIAIVYVLAQFAAMASLQDLSATKTPITDAASAILGRPGAILITVGAIISILGTNLGTVLESSRMVYALSHDRRPFRAIAWVHPRFHTPVFAILLIVIAAIPIAIFGSFVQLAAVSAVARLTTYLFTAAGVPRLRKLSEGFRTPGVIIPFLGTAIAVALFVMVLVRQTHFVPAVVAPIVGAVVWSIGRWHGPVD